MIDIIDKKDCVGCNACVQRCPKHCISMREDEQGFLYPKVDLDFCIQCNLCEKVCPVINQAESRKPLETLAAKNPDDVVRMTSSSGGIFYALAEKIIEEGGVVFGARFNNQWDVIHDYAETLEGVKAFQGSKYVQSRIGETFSQAEQFLKAGRKLIFTGTPCQIAALRLFLRKEYSNLLAVDVACHSVPSPKVWKNYINSKKDISFDSINFRDKTNGWLNYGFSLSDKNNCVFYQKSSENVYMRGFLNDLYSRPSCAACPAKAGKSGSDITLADFWGIWDVKPDFDSHTGASAVIVNSSKGMIAIRQLSSINFEKVNYEDIIRYNSALIKPAKFPKQRIEFWQKFEHKGIDCIAPIVQSMQPSFFTRLLRYTLRMLGLK